MYPCSSWNWSNARSTYSVRLGLAGDLTATISTRRSPDRTGRGERDPVEQPPTDVLERHAEERLEGGRTSVRAASSSVTPTSCRTGTTSRITNGMQMKIVTITIEGTANKIRMPWLVQPRFAPSAEPEQHHRHQPHDHGGHGQGQVDERAHQALPGKRSRAITSATITPKTDVTITVMTVIPRSGRTRGARRAASAWRRSSTTRPRTPPTRCRSAGRSPGSRRTETRSR